MESLSLKKRRKKIKMQPEYEFIKDDPEDLVFRVESEETMNSEGVHLFSFDGKTVLNFFRDFPQKLTKEQIEIFKKYNPTLAALKDM